MAPGGRLLGPPGARDSDYNNINNNDNKKDNDTNDTNDSLKLLQY